MSNLPQSGIPAAVSRPGPRDQNNFGLVRLVLAALVILAHSAELVDGNRSRELATQIWGTLTFGEIAVDGFFLISGYLVTQSFVQSRSLWSYIKKRALRIYPAFVGAFCLCVLLSPLVGGQLTLRALLDNALNVAFLLPPQVPNVFAGLQYPTLNGPMWSIAYEFRCYLLVAVAGTLGLLRYRLPLAVLTVACLAATGLDIVSDWQPGRLGILTGNAKENVRLTGCFLVGMMFYLHDIRRLLHGGLALAAVVLLAAALSVPQLAEPALVTLGGYALFWAIFKAPSTLSERLPGDLSYGIYLYGWPVQSVLIYYGLTEPWTITVFALAIAAILGALSWWGIERPAIVLAHRDSRRA